MESFTAYNPTRVHFGKGVTEEVGKCACDYGDRTMLIYGKGSAVKYGYYDRIKEQLLSAGLDIIEYSGIKPNPIIEDVDEAIKLGSVNESLRISRSSVWEQNGTAPLLVRKAV